MTLRDRVNRYQNEFLHEKVRPAKPSVRELGCIYPHARIIFLSDTRQFLIRNQLKYGKRPPLEMFGTGKSIEQYTGYRFHLRGRGKLL